MVVNNDLVIGHTSALKLFQFTSSNKMSHSLFRIQTSQNRTMKCHIMDILLTTFRRKKIYSSESR